MDYKKTNAPTNTVTRNMMDLCEDTGNVYETVAIIGKRANQISQEMKADLSLHTTTIWKKFLKTENKLKFHAITKNYRNQP